VSILDARQISRYSYGNMLQYVLLADRALEATSERATGTMYKYAEISHRAIHLFRRKKL